MLINEDYILSHGFCNNEYAGRVLPKLKLLNKLYCPTHSNLPQCQVFYYTNCFSMCGFIIHRSHSSYKMFYNIREAERGLFSIIIFITVLLTSYIWSYIVYNHYTSCTILIKALHTSSTFSQCFCVRCIGSFIHVVSAMQRWWKLKF